MGIIKRAFRSFNGTEWDKHYFETSADQVKYSESDGSETDLQEKVTALNSQLSGIRDGLYVTNDCNNVGTSFIATFSNYDGTGHAPSGEVRGILMTIVDAYWGNGEGFQFNQIFFSYYGSVYSRVAHYGQSYGDWIALT